MSQFEVMDQVNSSLKRVRRHLSFVDMGGPNLCFYPKAFDPNSTAMCDFIHNTPSCSYFVYYIDYLYILFCTLNLPWDSGVVFVAALILMMQYGLVYMILTYFFLPNYMALMRMLPISSYTYSFIYFGFCIFIPDYISTWLGCLYKNKYQASLVFSRIIGDALKFFVVGVLALCILRYRVNALALWCNMILLIMGLNYLVFVVDYKYDLFGRTNLVSKDSNLLRHNAWTFLILFTFILVLITLISYHEQKKQIRKLSSQVKVELPELSSDVEVPDKTEEPIARTKLQIWWGVVNGYANMKERRKIIVIVLTLPYFILANIITVIDNERPMQGWCKNVAINSFLAFPFVFIGLNPEPEIWGTVLICSWGVAFMVFITTHALHKPGHVGLRISCIVGMTMCSIMLQCVLDEIDNLMWQYMSMHLQPLPDMIAVLFFSTGEVFSLIVLIYHLAQNELYDAAYGSVMSIVTHSIFLALPQMALHSCYHERTYIVVTANTITCYEFTVVVYIFTLLYVSMSGNEFRRSLFFYLATLSTVYLIFQFMSYYEVIHPFGTLHVIKPPISEKEWA